MKTDAELEPPNRDLDPEETREWKDALEAVVERDGPERAHFLVEALVEKARRSGAYLPYNATTAYINTIPPQQETARRGDPALERRIKSHRALERHGHGGAGQPRRHRTSAVTSPPTPRPPPSTRSASTTSSAARPRSTAATWSTSRATARPGIYARAFLEGRLSEEQIAGFRQEVTGGGLSSYPHPWLMPDFWQFPTVSMGLAAITAIYQARFMRYLQHRGLIDAAGAQGLGVPGRRRDGRARVAGRDHRWPAARSSTT